MSSQAAHSLAGALLELDAIARRLRRECPWDREQDERSIVPHTIEEAYELAEAAHSGDDAKLLDELGDVLFQVYFLSLLLEERGQGSLDAVARTCTAKLVRRHPHVFGEDDNALAELPTDAATPTGVRKNWDAIKRGEAGGGDPLSSVPDNLPALLYARKIQKRAGQEAQSSVEGEHGSAEQYELIGNLLFDVVRLSRALEVDPEIALRRCTDRFRDSITAIQT